MAHRSHWRPTTLARQEHCPPITSHSKRVDPSAWQLQAIAPLLNSVEMENTAFLQSSGESALKGTIAVTVNDSEGKVHAKGMQGIAKMCNA